MAIDDTDRFPPEPLISGAKTLVRNGLMQTDMDANNFRILNLDTSNLVLDEIPTQGAVTNNWFNSYDQGTHSFGILRPTFVNIGGNLTLSQQGAITRVGHIILGEWSGTPLAPTRVPILNLIRPPANSLDLANQKIINLADPVVDSDAVNLRFLNLIANIHPKQAARLASTENMVLATLSHPIDGEAIFDNDRILAKNQAHPEQNGIYLAHPGAWTRSTDNDTCTEMDSATVFITEGDTQSGTTWLQENDPPANCIIGQAQWSWVIISRNLHVQAGPGIDVNGTIISAVGTANRISISTGIDIDQNYEGQDSIGIVGTIFQGTWEGDILESEFGGTGLNNHGFQISLAGNLTTTIATGAPVGSFVTFNLLGSSLVTLPVVGRLATLAGDETFTNKHISATQIDSGVLLISHGGTSANTAVEAANNLLPDQTGHAGQYLTTDGFGNLSWASPVPIP